MRADSAPAVAPAPSGSLARAGARGALWQGLAQTISKAIVLVTTIVLARLLSPQEYGLVALALVLLTYTETVADAGVAQALVYLRRGAETARAALLLCLLCGVVLAAALAGAAPALASAFGHSEVTPLIRVLALSVLATSLSAVPDALLRRALEFQRLTVAAVVRAAATGGVTLGLLLTGHGALSLAVGTVAGSVGYALACWLLLGERVSWQVWRARRKELATALRFGGPVAGGSLAARLIFDIDYLIVGALLGAQALGYYTLAFRLPELIIINVFFVLSTVLFPLYSRARADRSRLQRGYLMSMQIQSLYGVTAGIGLALVSPVVVPLVFGDPWSGAVVPLMLLSLYAAARSLGVGANEVYKALGRPGLSVSVAFCRLVVLLPVLLVATRWGIIGVAAAQVAVALLFAVGMQAVATRVMQIRPAELVRATAPAAECGLALAVVGGLIHLVPLQPLIGALLTMAAGVGSVYVVLRLRHPALLGHLIRLGRR